MHSDVIPNGFPGSRIIVFLLSISVTLLCVCGKVAGKEAGKRDPTNALEVVIFKMYGNPPPPKTAVTEIAAELAYEKLLLKKVPKNLVMKMAQDQNADQMPFSTEDLAIVVAHSIFKRPDMIARKDELFDAQMIARGQALTWYSEGKVNAYLLESFENTLYKYYKPGPIK